MAIQKVIIVFKTHFDIGYTDLAVNVLQDYYTTMLDRVLDTCEQTKDDGPLRYVWTMPAWPLWMILQHASPDRVERLEGFIRSGQVVWHALPYTSHYDAGCAEDAVWGLRYARLLSERFGMPLKRAAKMTDVPGQGRFLPELLAEAGIGFLHVGCNGFARPAAVPRIFRWQALSGKQMVMMYNAGYGTDLYAPEDWPFQTWMALMNTVDNSGPHSAAIIDDYVRKIKARYPGAEVVCGTLDDMLEALEAEGTDKLPVVTQDLADSWIHGVESYPREVGIVRRLHGPMSRACAKLSFDPPAAGAEQSRQALAEAYDLRSLFTEHTWGLDVKRGLGPIRDYDNLDALRDTDGFRLMEESWQEQRDRAGRARALCEQAEALLGITGDQPDAAAVPETAVCGEQTMSGGRYRMSWNADTGVIHAVEDLRTGAALLKAQDGQSAIRYRYDQYGADDLTEYLRAYAYRFLDWGLADYGRMQYPECPHRTCTPVYRACTVQGDTVRLHYDGCAEGCRIGDAEQVVLTITVPRDDSPVRVRVELKRKHAAAYIESGSLLMALPGQPDCWRIGKNGQLLDPERDIADWGNHALYGVETMAASVRDGQWTAVVPMDSSLASIGETGIHQYRRCWEAHEPTWYFNLFNTMWGTNFPQWLEGDYSWEFCLFGAEHVDQALAVAEHVRQGDAPALPFALPEGLRMLNCFPAEDGTVQLVLQNLQTQPRTCVIGAEGWMTTPVTLNGVQTGSGWSGAADADFAPFALRAFRMTKQA